MKQTLLHKSSLSRKVLMFAAVLGMAAMPTKAMAHQVQTNYFVNNQADDSLELRTTFGNGEPLKGAKVTVYSPDQPLRARVTGITDSQGRFTFQADNAISGEWEVNIERAGHQDILNVPVTPEGIDLDLMASNGIEQGGSDIHYAGASPWAAIGSVAIALACVGAARVGSKKSA